MLFSQIKTASADTTTTRNGVNYGMNTQEVINAEKNNGVEFKDIIIGENTYSSLRVTNKARRNGFLGFKNVDFYYWFRNSDQQMDHYGYIFYNDELQVYLQLKDALEQKYGEPSFPNSNYQISPLTNEHIIADLDQNMETIKERKCLQWVVLNKDDGDAFVITLCYKAILNKYSDTGYLEECYLYYNYAEKEAIETELKKKQDLINDL